MMRVESGTKQRILDVSTRLFASKGFDGTAVSSICNECEITKPTLYHHFDNKDGLLAAVCQSCLELFREFVGDAIQYEGDIHREIPQLFHRIIRIRDKYPDHFQIISDSFFSGRNSNFSLISKPLREHIRADLVNFFLGAADGHGNLSGKEAMLAFSLIGSVSAMVNSSEIATSGEKHKAQQQIIQNFMFGIFS